MATIVYSNPASSRGGFEIEMALNLVGPYDLGKMGPGSAEALHLEIEAIKVSKADIYHFRGSWYVSAAGDLGADARGRTHHGSRLGIGYSGSGQTRRRHRSEFAVDAKPNFYKPGAEISITMEKRVPQASMQKLGEWGHKINATSDFTAAVGGMQAIVIDAEKGTMFAGADPRRTGYAVGW